MFTACKYTLRETVSIYAYVYTLINFIAQWIIIYDPAPLPW